MRTCSTNSKATFETSGMQRTIYGRGPDLHQVARSQLVASEAKRPPDAPDRAGARIWMRVGP
jgi:hypothetical protein